jgi:NADH-quinone oxidoreductase subunit F
VFIATGATASKRIGILGEEKGLEGLHYGLDFLSRVRSGAEVSLKGRVVVIGGGNVAIDVARTAFRLGAKDVQVFCRKPKKEMRAREEEVLEAEEEGIVIHPSWAPRRILAEDGCVAGVEFVGSISAVNGEGVTENGFDERESCMVEAGSIIISVGQVPDISFLSKDSQIEMELWRGSLRVDENTLSSNVPGVFAGGDFVTGPTSLIRAIASGFHGICRQIPCKDPRRHHPPHLSPHGPFHEQERRRGQRARWAH